MTDITTSYTTHNYHSNCGPYCNRETVFLSFNSLHSYFQLPPIIFVAYTPSTAPKPACIKNLIYSKISAPANVPQPFKRLFLRWRLAVLTNFWFSRNVSPCKISQPFELMLHLPNYSRLHKNFPSFGLTYRPLSMVTNFHMNHYELIS